MLRSSFDSHGRYKDLTWQQVHWHQPAFTCFVNTFPNNLCWVVALISTNIKQTNVVYSQFTMATALNCHKTLHVFQTEWEDLETVSCRFDFWGYDLKVLKNISDSSCPSWMVFPQNFVKNCGRNRNSNLPIQFKLTHTSYVELRE